MTLIRAVLAALLLAGLAFAQQTPAGTEAGTQIQNQATANYIDSGGVARSVDSNLVITTVQQVYNLSITPDGTIAAPGQTKDATPGSVVYFSYTLTNDGNGTDTFALTSDVVTSPATGPIAGIADATPVFYLDSDGDGVRDTNEPEITTVDDLAAGESVKLIMSYQIPEGASEGNTVTASPIGTSQGADAGDPNSVDDNNYHQTTVVQDAAITASKSVRRVVNPGSSETFASGDTASVGDTLEYIITARNTGSAAAQSVEISDTLPAGVTYVAGSASTEPVIPTGDLDASGPITATFATVASGQTVELTFRVTVNTDTESDDLENVATVDFNDASGTDRPDVTTNTTTTTVASASSVALGPNGQPNAAAAVTSYTTSEGYTVDPVSGNNDAQVVATASAGTSVSFVNTVRNTGSDTDTFNLTSALTDLPGAASTVEFFTLNGTRLLDTNGDNIPDTGPLAADTNYDFITRVTIPANKPTDTTAANLSVEVAATSVTNSDTTDTTTNIIQDIGGAGVSFGNADDTDGSVDPDPDPRTVAPGDTVVFPMDVVNNGSTSDTFNLTGSVPFTGGDVAVVYYPASADTDGDGTLSPAEIAAANPISNTGPIAAGQETTVFAVVNVPADAEPQADVAVNQSVTSPTSGAEAEFNDNEITVGTDTTFSFTPNRTGNVTSPGTVIYEHTLVNNGNANITEVSFTDTQSGLGADNFTYTYAFDTDGDGESDDETFYPVDSSSLTLPADITPGNSQQLFVKVNAPSGVTTGAENTLTITAEATFTSGTAPNTTTSTATQSVTDTTIVVGGELSLTKTATTTTPGIAAPGENITYEIIARNLGTDDLTAVVISDPLPAFTDFVSVEVEVNGFPAPQPTLLYSTDGTDYTAIAAGTTYGDAATAFPGTASAPSTGGSIYIGVDRDGDATDTTVDSSDTFPPGATVTITFVVEVQ